MRANPKRLMWVLGIQLSLGSIAHAQQPPAFWRGTGSTDKVSDLEWLKLLVHYDSEFSFSTDVAGNVAGMATVRYTLRVDDSRLRTLLANFNLGNAVTNQQLALLPIGGAEKTFGSVLGMATKFHELQGVDGSLDGGTVVRQGRITGRLEGHHLHLQWATAPPPMPYTVYKVYALRREAFKADEAPGYSPWIVDADLSQPANGHREARVPDSASRKTTRTSSWTVVWSAHEEAAAK